MVAGNLIYKAQHSHSTGMSSWRLSVVPFLEFLFGVSTDVCTLPRGALLSPRVSNHGVMSTGHHHSCLTCGTGHMERHGVSCWHCLLFSPQRGVFLKSFLWNTSRELWGRQSCVSKYWMKLWTHSFMRIWMHCLKEHWKLMDFISWEGFLTLFLSNLN